MIFFFFFSLQSSTDIKTSEQPNQINQSNMEEKKTPTTEQQAISDFAKFFEAELR